MGAGETLQAVVERGLAYAMEPRLAPYYERHLVGECLYRTHEVLAGQLAARTPPPGRFLDLGAGSGLVGKAIAARRMELELVAVDLSQAMLDLIDLPIYVGRQVADCTGAMPFDDGSFEGAVAAGLLEHLVAPHLLFREAARAVKPGGLFLFSFPPNHAGRTELFDVEQGLVSHDGRSIRNDLESAGWRIEGQIDFQAYVNGSRGPTYHRCVTALREPVVR